MRNSTVVFGGALCVLLAAEACSKEKPAEDTTTTRGEYVDPTSQTPVSIEEVRTALLEKRPIASDSINSIIITNDDGVITLRGKVDDESTHGVLVNRVREMPNVRGVRDELQVEPPTALQSNPPPGPYSEDKEMSVGTTSTTGADLTAIAGGERIDSVRQSMIKARPKSETTIQALTITTNDDATVVTLAGQVPDEATHQALLKAAKGTAGVKTVKDQMTVGPAKKLPPAHLQLKR